MYDVSDDWRSDNRRSTVLNIDHTGNSIYSVNQILLLSQFFLIA